MIAHGISNLQETCLPLQCSLVQLEPYPTSVREHSSLVDLVWASLSLYSPSWTEDLVFSLSSLWLTTFVTLSRDARNQSLYSASKSDLSSLSMVFRAALWTWVGCREMLAISDQHTLLWLPLIEIDVSDNVNFLFKLRHKCSVKNDISELTQ